MQTLKLILPIFFPSWQFFKEIAPSPRIEFYLCKTAEEIISNNNWQEFSLIPQKLSTASILKSLFFNPERNETYFILNCAEQLIINPSEFRSQEIMQRIKMRLERNGIDFQTSSYLQFRLVFVHRQKTELKEEVLFVSEVYKIEEDAI
jgi:hypothetical protein